MKLNNSDFCILKGQIADKPVMQIGELAKISSLFFALTEGSPDGDLKVIGPGNVEIVSYHKEKN